MKTWKGNPEVWILNVHGNRKGSIVGWHEGYQMWEVKILSGQDKGQIHAFHEVDLQRR